MKILFLTYDLPYPLVAGGKIRAYYLLKALAKKHQITLFSYYRNEEQKKYLSELEKYCQEIKLFKRGKPWSWQNLLRTFTSKLPFASATYYSPALAKALLKELKERKFDLVHFESFYPALYLPLVKKQGLKTVLGNENIEYRIYQRYAESRNPLLKILLKPEVWKMKHFEEKLWQQADINLTLSEEDAQVIRKAKANPCFLIPNGVAISFFKPKKPGDGQKLIFIGNLLYQANQDAMKFFLAKIYPLIERQNPKVKFILVSSHQPNWLKQFLKDKSIHLIQDQERAAKDFLTQGDVFVAPMRIASGTNIKILEAMAAGLPVVTTTVGIEGIEAKKEVIIADQPEDFAHQVVSLLKDKAKCQQLGEASRELVKKKYDWQKIGEKLSQVLEEI
jgi:glycosyltransferase involved in cell wall biosynthesis